MPALINSLLGTSNQITVTNTDPNNPIVTLANPVTFGSNITLPNSSLLTASNVSFPSFINVFTTLPYPSGVDSFLYSDNTSGTGHFSWQEVDPSPQTQPVTFSFGGTNTYTADCVYSQNGNLGVIKMNLTGLNVTSGTTAYGIDCDHATPTFTSTTTLTNFPTPSYWSTGDRIFIGQLPIGEINTTTHVFQTYYMGNVYLYNDMTLGAQLQFTLGGTVGAGGGVNFSSSTSYAFGYINTGFSPNSTALQPLVMVPTAKVAAFSYMIN